MARRLNVDKAPAWAFVAVAGALECHDDAVRPYVDLFVTLMYGNEPVGDAVDRGCPYCRPVRKQRNTQRDDGTPKPLCVTVAMAAATATM
jgi:hypothetical protein